MEYIINIGDRFEAKVTTRSTLIDVHKELFLNSYFGKLRSRTRCSLKTTPDEADQEYLTLFAQKPRKDYPLLDAYFYEGGEYRGVGYEEQDDDVQSLRFSFRNQTYPPTNQTSPSRRQPSLFESRPCRRQTSCDHDDLLRQLLQHIIQRIIEGVMEMNEERLGLGTEMEVQTQVHMEAHVQAEEETKVVQADGHTKVHMEAQVKAVEYIEEESVDEQTERHTTVFTRKKRNLDKECPQNDV
ncbi:Uncharacterized protein Adt_27720 [Abeliophyllum distichum]|uniref:BTB domain-containing protein n=1 Tax=Abeliophyllum distichum TaxID=126358 RepID=A0ABD1RUJ8_9LAMI